VADLLVYALVAAAAVWVVWSVVLPRSLKARLSARKSRGCDGDGGCGNCGD
jgi:hypothetical protein